jgi:hypothetical protein
MLKNTNYTIIVQDTESIVVAEYFLPYGKRAENY